MIEELKPHLSELRTRLLISMVVTLAAFSVCFAFWKDLLEIAKLPLEDAFSHGVRGKMIQISPAEAIFVSINLSLTAGIALSMPINFWQFWQFIVPGLYKHERNLLAPFVIFATVMFLLGLLFCYFIVLPVIVKYVLAFGNDVADADISLGEYMSFFTRFMLGFGLIFELPVVLFFFGKVGLVTDKILLKYSRHAVVGVFVIAAIITPPDVVSQILFALPMVALYIFSYLMLKLGFGSRG